jgi:hypothetical protein
MASQRASPVNAPDSKSGVTMNRPSIAGTALGLRQRADLEPAAGGVANA